MKNVFSVAAIAGAILLSSTQAEAGCNAACKQFRAEKNAVWKTRKTYMIGGKAFHAAVSPKHNYVLVKPAKSSTKLSVNTLEAVATAASGCSKHKNEDMKTLAILTGKGLDGPLPLRKIESGKWVIAYLGC